MIVCLRTVEVPPEWQTRYLRCQTRVAVAVALSLSATHKAVGFDRRMPEVDFDSLDLPGSETLPVALGRAGRSGGARNRQHPCHPAKPSNGSADRG
jgi:hypothetical protein